MWVTLDFDVSKTIQVGKAGRCGYTVSADCLVQKGAQINYTIEGLVSLQGTYDLCTVVYIDHHHSPVPAS